MFLQISISLSLSAVREVMIFTSVSSFAKPSIKYSLAFFEENKIDLIHVDIMDGSFVPNFTLGTDFVKKLKARTTIPLDIHLMIDNPESKLDWFEFGEDDYVSVHYESTKHLHKAINTINVTTATILVGSKVALALSLAR